LIIDDDAVIGPGAMINGCHIGRSSIDRATGRHPPGDSPMVEPG
jgi:hypothetical protein